MDRVHTTSELILPSSPQDACLICLDLQNPSSSRVRKIPCSKLHKGSETGCGGCKLLLHLLQLYAQAWNGVGACLDEDTAYLEIYFGLNGDNEQRETVECIGLYVPEVSEHGEIFEIFTESGMPLQSNPFSGYF